MRARRTRRVPTAAKMVVGASVLAFPATAVALTTNGTAATSPQAPGLSGVHAESVRYGKQAIVRGAAPAGDAGSSLELEYRPANAANWRTVGTGRVQPDGRFSLSARLGRSGRIQVLQVPGQTIASGQSPNQVSPGETSSVPTSTTVPTGTTTATPGVPGPGASAVTNITVAPELKLAKHTGTAILGRPAQVSGRFLPGLAGRRVELEVRRGHRWIPVAAGRTRRGGGFDVHFTPAPTGSEVVHVAFGGDRVNGHADSATESITAMQYAEVSWYYDAGDTACGFHATYGIASRTLPCGSKVTLSYGGRTVVATVDDRGPFVYSRLYDLNQTTAAAIGMDGVATVLASV